jgi:hypothetical protein
MIKFNGPTNGFHRSVRQEFAMALRMSIPEEFRPATKNSTARDRALQPAPGRGIRLRSAARARQSYFRMLDLEIAPAAWFSDVLMRLGIRIASL